ncbi:DUF4383 domain-containing protein [Microbacterium sp. p3-SID336]|uniref:DUF4383 domain-containing protein n=1 Tax=Microbacterium sp. p3-SID336 TaxID=2916212 RepID=UPI0021A9119E|nr:DUF4383 domain-containing protein [Microbacterium sp. p3-SID336]MCT1476433.1 DUF4383 domain-containing protein [Microbacterium sp. p3-SID336]
MTDTARTTRYAQTPIQKTALIVGIVFLIVGIAGFIPGVTHSAEHLHGAGAGSEALLLGVFQVSVLHNIVHLLFAVGGIALAASARASRLYLIIGGLAYLVVWLYGLIAVGNDQLNFLPVNNADNWLHLGLAVGMVLLGIFVSREPRVPENGAHRARA